MIEVALVAVSLVALSLVGAFVWAIVRGDTRGDQLIKEREAHGKAVRENERLAFELKQSEDALAEEKRVNAALLKEPDAKPHNLAAGDVDGRSLRAAEQARAAEANRNGAVRPVGDSTVHPQGATKAREAAKVLPVGPLDPNESLL